MNRFNQKLISFVLLICMVIPLCACGSGTADDLSSGSVRLQNGEAPSPSPTAEPTPEPTPEPEVLHEPGPYFDGYDLHYAGDDGIDIRNDSVGFLTFDENGVYTTGNPDLDGRIREILVEQVDPAVQTRDEMLRTLYDYVVFGFGYGGGKQFDVGLTGWEEEWAIQLLDRGKGNCYGYAALFALLARAVGYQAEGVSGNCCSGVHAWTEITIDDEVLISDPEYQACNDWMTSYFNMNHSTARKRAYKNPNRS